MAKITLLIHCADTSGIIASVTSFFHSHKGNIIYIDQYVDNENKTFFMRLECEFQYEIKLNELKNKFEYEIGTPYNMVWQLFSSDTRLRMAIFVSKYDHCLYDILSRYKSGELSLDIPMIISNHEDLKHVAENFDIPFYHIPVQNGEKNIAEREQLELLEQEKIDFIVLARYMQIVSTRMIDKYPNRIINIHHSFLPAFAGAKPYHFAYKRGVKIIGATCHYVTDELDAGPIIEQDIARISHSHAVRDLILKGRDLEKIVLARGIKLHLERKTMVYDNRVIVFT
ncbi:formyltetrahydrofolate deformylase [Christiangramia sabulilitoris]|uniref:Formyltetrahydrofolate deformylase n=1 Tax=Christiangramia sabulilitoris TaxID=2583991 RepID=A0A550HZ42_9FLAO|nr:formyltetrahydrofolate deformylase [Christiangramia sabulilitoris]TRO63987.1 formyltetrahydrofolate deformylase [Christiangramia sabulilitoris]